VFAFPSLAAAVVLIAWGLLGAAAAAWRIARGAGGGRLLALALAPWLLAGPLALVLFSLALLGVAWSPGLFAALLLVGGAVGGAWGVRGGLPTLALPPGRAVWGAAALSLLLSAAVLFNAGYWPFQREDVLAVYQPQAAAMAETGALLPLRGADSLYLAYPMLVQLNSAAVYTLAGWPAETTAGLLIALLALSSLPACAHLATQIGGVQAGAWAALLLAAMPTFGRWSSSGYVDLPMAATYTLAAAFAVGAWQAESPARAARCALCAGACMGAAAFTKNAALVGVGAFALWLGAAWACGRISGRAALGAASACALIAAPWYLRNLAGAGFLMPATAWVDQAERTLFNLFPFALGPENFAASGFLITAGGLGWLVQLARGRAPAAVIIAGGAAAALFAAWWAFASYDSRFLLLIAPLLCALGGAALARVFATGTRARRAARWACAAVLVVSFAYTLWVSVEHKDHIIRDPLMGWGDKLAVIGRAPP
jgi:hypothetical protein